MDLKYELTPTPLANGFADVPDIKSRRYPLQLMSCMRCNHVQLSSVPDRETLYLDYKYATPTAQKPRLQAYARSLREKYPRARNSFEIGANNGLLVHAMHDEGFFAGGIDPTPQDAFVLRGFFGPEAAWDARRRNGKFDLILANNVFAHVDDFDSVMQGVDLLLAEDGALIFEVQYLVDMLENGMFDMVYHEHHDYHHLKPLELYFAKYGFVISEWERLPDHGGSIRVTVSRRRTAVELPEESIDFEVFDKKINLARERVSKLKGTVVAFGATAKACTLIHHFGLQDRIKYCVDETPAKIGKYIPGTNIKIHGKLLDTPDTLFLTAWNYADILRKRFPNLNVVTPF